MNCRYWVTLGSLNDIRQVNTINPNLTFGFEHKVRTRLAK